MNETIPDEARKAFKAQRNNSSRRDIPFLFSLEEWWAWWQVDNRWANRGRKGHQYVMCRREDIGPYSPGNVYCGTGLQNLEARGPNVIATSEYVEALWAGRRARGEPCHLSDRACHPKNRGVVTPDGYFPSAAQAGERYGITSAGAANRCHRGIKGWRWAPDP
jgi:hypothetical protein